MANYDTHWQNIVKITAFLVMAIAVVFILKTLKGIFIPLVMAIFFTYLFAPVVEFFAKFKIPRIVTLFIIIGIICVVGIFFTQLLVRNIKEFITLWPTMESRIISGIGAFLLEHFNINIRDLSGILQSRRITEMLSSALNISVSVIGKIFLTLLILIFIYLTYHNFPRLIKKAFDREKSRQIFLILGNINQQIIRYIFIKTVISAGTGVCTGVACALFGIRFAILWGALAFLLNYIPYIGSLIAVIIPIILSILQFQHSFIPLFAGLTLIGIQLLLGSFLDPEMMGTRFNLSPILILVSLFFWGYVWGVVGAFLAVPMTAVMKIVIQNIEPLKFVAVLMSKRAD